MKIKIKYFKSNELYNLCGNCQYYDEYGCWQPDCIRKHKRKNNYSKDMKLEMGLPWIPIKR